MLALPSKPKLHCMGEKRLVEEDRVGAKALPGSFERAKSGTVRCVHLASLSRRMEASKQAALLSS